VARPQVVDVIGSFQIWRISVNVLDKQSRTADKGWSTSFGSGWERFERGHKNPSPKTLMT
jgi:hypothetical protein